MLLVLYINNLKKLVLTFFLLVDNFVKYQIKALFYKSCGKTVNFFQLIEIK